MTLSRRQIDIPKEFYLKGMDAAACRILKNSETRASRDSRMLKDRFTLNVIYLAMGFLKLHCEILSFTHAEKILMKCGVKQQNDEFCK